MIHGSIATLVLLLALSPATPASESRSAAGLAPADGTVRVANSADGVSIRYRVYGRGDPAVVLIHGWSCDSSYWSAQLEELTAKYTVVTVDLAGHGESGRNRHEWSMANFGEDVAAAVRQIPNPRVVLVGHSLGGSVMLEAAHLFRERVIGLIGVEVDTFKVAGHLPRTPQEIEEVMAPYREDFMGYMRKFVTGNFFTEGTDPLLVQKIAEDMALAPPEVAIPSGEAHLRLELDALLRDTDVPIVAINATRGGATDEARIRKRAPGFRAVILDGVGHFPMIEQPQRFNRVLLGEIASLTTTTIETESTQIAESMQTEETSNASSDASDAKLEEITVTARKREERLQDVPDAVTVLTGANLDNAGITSVPDFMKQIPNLTFQDGSSFRAGAMFMTLRGVGNGDAGWAPVTYIVDGVPADSLASVNSGTLIDIERIEVLRGPQSALYGAGAIAGAINVLTRRPTDVLELRTKATYAKGNDKRLEVNASGPLVADKLYYRLSGYYRDSDGLIDSASNGIDLDFAEHEQFRGRFLYTPNDALELDLRAELLQEDNGATYQAKFPRAIDLSQLDEWNDSTDPRRRTPGIDVREFKRFALKALWELPGAIFDSVTGYSETDQHLDVGICWDDPDNPAVDADLLTPGTQVGCVFNPSLGSAAAPGQFVDNRFDAVNNAETWTQDFRLTSPGDQKWRWLTGVQLLHRNTFDGSDSGVTVAPDEHFVSLSSRWDVREDFWWGVYGQLSYDLTDKLELTGAARYDDNTYKNTQYSDRNKTALVPSPDAGAFVNTLREKASQFQPKVQLSYQWREDKMVYLTWAEGFRAGFFNVGRFTAPESTTNYEAGIKVRWLGGRIVTNTAVFHIDYSNQQTTTRIPTPPFVVPATLPETNIDGVEVESTWQVNRMLTLTGAVGYLHSRLDVTDLRPPYTSDWTGTASADFVYPVSADWNLHLHGDYRYHSDLYLQRDENPLSRVPVKDFVDLRAGLFDDQWRVTLFMKNALDTREAVRTLTDQGAAVGGIIRGPNLPRSYGVEVGYSF